MIILEDTRQQAGKHDKKHEYFAQHGIKIERCKLYRGDYHRLCVAMPPRHAKSSMISLAFPLWLIFHNPNLNIHRNAFQN